MVALLVVDDEVHLAGELAEAAVDEGYVVHVAYSAGSALDAIAQHPDIGVMVSDIRMPDGDGLTLTKQVLASRAEIQAIEVILITGHATLSDAISAVQTGAFDFIRKPFHLQDILGVVSRARARSIGRRRIAEARRLPATPQAAGPESAATDPEAPEAILHGMIYELRTPLVPVLGFAELLETPSATAEVREYARHIGVGARLLLTTVEDLITLTQIDRGQAPFITQRVDAGRLLRELLADHSAEASLIDVTLTIVGSPDVELQADPVLARRALDVLLRVALRQAARGGAITMSVAPALVGPAATFGFRAREAAVHQGGAPRDALATALQLAPLGIRLAQAVVRLHAGELVLNSGPDAVFDAQVIFPGVPAVNDLRSGTDTGPGTGQGYA